VQLAGEPVKKETFFEYKFNGGENVPKIIKQPQNKFLLAHTLANDLSCQGILEPLEHEKTCRLSPERI
jgi:hypothetical protein